MTSSLDVVISDSNKGLGLELCKHIFLEGMVLATEDNSPSDYGPSELIVHCSPCGKKTKLLIREYY